MFKGSIPALITPFKNTEIDWKAFDNFAEWQIEQGSSGLVPCGTTGESPTLSHDEHKRVVQRCVDIAKGRIPVIAGSGSNSTDEAIDLTQAAKDSGADAALVVTPYYNKPTQEGLYHHYKTIHDAVSIPIIIYNIPGRCIVDMDVDTMCRLAELPGIVGVKDATADLARPLEIRNRLGGNFCQLSGEDATATGFLAQGGHGCISVTANVAPALCAAVQQAWRDNDIKKMESLRDQLAPLHKALFIESSPAPIKYALSKLGLCTDQVRLPLMPATNNCRKIVNEAMAFAELLSDKNAPKLQAHG